MEQQELLNLCEKVYKKTLGYSIDKVKINDDGTTSHIHSDEFLNSHPERKNNPEFTKEEEIEELKFLYKLAKLW